MPIVADTKNWTWVVERPCPECGFDASFFEDADIAPAILNNADAWPALLERPSLRVRPDDSTWSPLEYAAHVRDVMAVYRERLRLMVETDDPLYPNWDQDESAIAERYNEQDPVVVGAQIAANASDLAGAFDSLASEQWLRTGRRDNGAGAAISSFTVSSMAKYMTHDLIHHRWDVSALGANEQTGA